MVCFFHHNRLFAFQYFGDKQDSFAGPSIRLILYGANHYIGANHAGLFPATLQLSSLSSMVRFNYNRGFHQRKKRKITFIS